MNASNLIFILLSIAVRVNLAFACEQADENIRNKPFIVPTIEEIFSSSKQLSENIKVILPSLSLTPKEYKQHEGYLFDLDSDNLSRIHHALGQFMVTFAKLIKKPENISKIQDSLILLRENIKSRPLKNFQNKSLEYFSSFFGDNFKEIEFQEKTSGRQLGKKVIIKLNNDTEILYHSKTHGKGLLSGSSASSAQPVNPKELFIYKYLELTGLGQEVHFFYDDVCNFYIATKGTESEEFQTYNKIRITFEEYKREFEEKDEERIDPVISNGLVITDIISRVFRLSDLVSNPGNIGCIFMNNKMKSFKIIDFDVNDNLSYYAPEVFQGFLSGNGVHNYAYSQDGVIRYYLSKRDIKKRVNTAREIIRDMNILTENLIEKSYNFVLLFLRNSQLDLPESAFADLENYVSSVKKNLCLFLTGLEEV